VSPREPDAPLGDSAAISTGCQGTHVDECTVGAHGPGLAVALGLAWAASTSGGWWSVVGGGWWWRWSVVGGWWWWRTTLRSRGTARTALWAAVTRSLDLRSRVGEIDLSPFSYTAVLGGNVGNEHVRKRVECALVGAATTNGGLMAAHVHLTVTTLVEPGPSNGGLASGKVVRDSVLQWRKDVGAWVTGRREVAIDFKGASTLE